MELFTITRVLDGRKRGSSRPVLADTTGGRRLIKLRGAAQGTGALLAEIVVAALAEALELSVPERSLAILPPDVPTDDREDELGDLLRASVGVNLAFEILPNARDATPDDLDRIDPAEQAAILWLDRLTLNLDRTRRNPNLLIDGAKPWLIDHGAALRFQYNWSAVTESAPREVGLTVEPHVFESAGTSPDWPAWDQLFAARITREILEAAIALVPDTFLEPMLPREVSPESGSEATNLSRRRAAYVAYLWKRLREPRAFALSRPQHQVSNQPGRSRPASAER